MLERRRQVRRSRVLAFAGCLALLGTSCPRATSTLRDPFAERAPTRFELSLLRDQSRGTPATIGNVCAIEYSGAPQPDLPAEVGLKFTLSRRGVVEQRGTTDASGAGALIDRADGFHDLFLATGDDLLQGRHAVELRARVTRLYGQIGPDVDDLDADGDRGEWLLRVDVIPDDDGDGVADGGWHQRWVFGVDGGVAWSRRDASQSERVVLDSEFLPGRVELFDDLDGDFIADDEDADRDGDGLLDRDEGRQLICPATRHQQFGVEGSPHQSLRCERCHDDTLEQPLACEDCHSQAGRQPDDTPDNLPADHFARRCAQCHVADQPWDRVPGIEGENHTRYPLTGRHLQADCFGCHRTGNIQDLATDCAECHRSQTPPNHAQENCQICHITAAWRPPLVSHEQFPLVGGHGNLACIDCHEADRYTGLSTACASCHLDDAPSKHAAPGFAGVACDQCHNIVDWADYDYAHSVWLIDGKHSLLTCADCHQDNPSGYTGNEPHCEFCHDTPPTFPDHGAFDGTCQHCHTTAGWVPARIENIDHSTWPLVGSHRTAACATCHDNGHVLHPPRTCSGCHQATRPARHQGTFEGECDQCHQPTSWLDLQPPFVHVDTFPLDGAHAAQSCAACHPTSYVASPECVSCHDGDRPPNHYGNDCATCHTTADWTPTGDMNHHTADAVALPLIGRHGQLLCSDCHGAQIGALDSRCESCHFNTRPAGHAQGGCASCHTPAGWSNASQPTPNAFHPLTGRHVGVGCVDCHGSWVDPPGEFATARPQVDCESCHSLPVDHFTVQNPACATCHNVDGWTPALGHVGTPPTGPFDYQSWSGRWFPVPHHSARNCDDCHTRIGQNDLRFFTCTSCHEHSSRSRLDDKHNNGRDEGSEAKKQFHLYHFDPNAGPYSQGGATWATAHTGCVNRSCHDNGRKP